MPVSKREIAKSVKTLLVLLQSLKKQQVTITLRNDTIVKGTIIKVDDCMNIELENAIVEDDLFYKTNNNIKESKQQIDYMNVDNENDNNIENGELEQVDDDMNINSDNQETIKIEQQQQLLKNVITNGASIGKSLQENSNINHDDQEINIDGGEFFENNNADNYDDEEQCYSDSDDDDVDINDSIGASNTNNNEGDYCSNNMHDYFLVKGSRVRHIDLPSDCDLVACAKSEIERIRNRNRPWSKKDIV